MGFQVGNTCRVKIHFEYFNICHIKTSDKTSYLSDKNLTSVCSITASFELKTSKCYNMTN